MCIYTCTQKYKHRCKLNCKVEYPSTTTTTTARAAQTTAATIATAKIRLELLPAKGPASEVVKNVRIGDQRMTAKV